MIKENQFTDTICSIRPSQNNGPSRLEAKGVARCKKKSTDLIFFAFKNITMIPGGYHPGITVRKGNASISTSENGQAFHFLCRWAFHFF
jgi:hypothetical protein